VLGEVGDDQPKRVRVLDRTLGRLFPFVDASIVFAQGDWEHLSQEDAPDVAELLDGAEQMPPDDPAAALAFAPPSPPQSRTVRVGPSAS
jgi:hypothetical protein